MTIMTSVTAYPQPQLAMQFRHLIEYNDFWGNSEGVFRIENTGFD